MESVNTVEPRPRKVCLYVSYSAFFFLDSIYVHLGEQDPM
jgi:hypothetical protein